MALNIKGQIHITLNPNLIFFGDNVLSNVVFTQVVNLILFGFKYLFFYLCIIAFLSKCSFERLKT